MKQQLYINQINYFISKTKNKLKELHIDKEKGFLTDLDFKNGKSRLNGAIQALDININNDIQDQIMLNIKTYRAALTGLKINLLNKADVNFPIFYVTGGAIDISYMLLTIFDNPQSCCPLNKEFLLNKSLNEIEEKMDLATQSKDKKLLNELKGEFNIIKKLYQDNLQYL